MGMVSLNLTFWQIILAGVDTFLEAVYPLTFMLNVDKESSEYPYDPFVMQSFAILIAFLFSVTIDYLRDRKVPSFNVGWDRLSQGAVSASFLVIGLIFITTGFKTATSGAAATAGFLALPTYVLITTFSAIVRQDMQEWDLVQDKLKGVSREILLIITSCAILFILADEDSDVEGILWLVAGRTAICIKSYINGKVALVEEDPETISDRSIFLFFQSSLMYLYSQPAALAIHGFVDWYDLIPHGWTTATLIPFICIPMIDMSNVLVETKICGEMQAITGMLGRILAMYMAFAYDVAPTNEIVLAVISVTFGVVAYMRLHYKWGDDQYGFALNENGYQLLKGKPNLFASLNPDFASCQTF